MNLSETGAINAAKSKHLVPTPVGIMPEPCLDGQTALASHGSVLRAGRVKKKPNKEKTRAGVPPVSQGSEMSSPARDVSEARSRQLPASWGSARNRGSSGASGAGSPSSNTSIFYLILECN